MHFSHVGYDKKFSNQLYLAAALQTGKYRTVSDPHYHLYTEGIKCRSWFDESSKVGRPAWDSTAGDTNELNN